MQPIHQVMQCLVLLLECGIVAAGTTPRLAFAPHDYGGDPSGERSGVLPRVFFPMSTTLHILGKHCYVEEALNTLIVQHRTMRLSLDDGLLINEYRKATVTRHHS